jgi:hypothetical protein
MEGQKSTCDNRTGIFCTIFYVVAFFSEVQYVVDDDQTLYPPVRTCKNLQYVVCTFVKRFNPFLHLNLKDPSNSRNLLIADQIC